MAGTVVENDVAEAAPRAQPKPSLARRIFSLTGVLPVAVFLVVHLAATSMLLVSRAAYDRFATSTARGAGLVAELVFVVAPLAFHAAYGVVLAIRPDAGPRAYPTARVHALVRLTGIVALAFVAYHLAHLRSPALGGAAPASYATTLARTLSSTSSGVPWPALAYVAGLLACTFHLGAGARSFWLTWRPAQSAEAQRRGTRVIAVVAALLFVVGLLVVVQLATGTRLLSPAEEGRRALCGSAVTLPGSSSLPSSGP